MGNEAIDQMSTANPTPAFLIDASETFRSILEQHGFVILAACFIVPTLLSYLAPYFGKLGNLFTSNRVDPRVAERMVQRRMEQEALFQEQAEIEKQVRKEKERLKQQKKLEEIEQGKEGGGNKTHGSKLGGTPGSQGGFESYKPSGTQRRGGGG